MKVTDVLDQLPRRYQTALMDRLGQTVEVKTANVRDIIYNSIDDFLAIYPSRENQDWMRIVSFTRWSITYMSHYTKMIYYDSKTNILWFIDRGMKYKPVVPPI